jgi:hypothetical protein
MEVRVADLSGEQSSPREMTFPFPASALTNNLLVYCHNGFRLLNLFFNAANRISHYLA